MEENSSISFWKIAVTILLAAILIGVVFLIARQGKSVANEKLEGISNTLAEYQDESYAMYAGMEVSGAEVRDVIDRVIAKGDAVCVRVFTKADTAGTDYIKKGAPVSAAGVTSFTSITDGGLTTVTSDKGATTYINPSAVFQCKMSRNANGAFIGLTFVQQ